MMTELLLAAAPATPLIMLVAGLLAPALRLKLMAMLPLAPAPGLLAAAAALLPQPDGAGPLLAESVLLGSALSLDRVGAIFTGFASILWIAAGAYARTYLLHSPERERFATFWLLTLAGNLGAFLAADLATFYLFFGLLSLAAYGLVVHDGTARAHRAGLVYLILAIFGEICLLLALMLLAAHADSLWIAQASAALPTSPWRDLTLALLVAGFGIKAGLMPLHVWLPLAHPAAPTPASAVLSGVIIKAGIIGLMRFLPLEAGAPGWDTVLIILGLATAYAGVLIGLTQRHPKAILAYSSLSQMGLIVTALGTGLSRAGGQAELAQAATLYAVHHGLAKGALFLSVGLVGAMDRRRIRPVLILTGLVGLGVAGLPLTGGALAKLELKAPLQPGPVATLVSLSAIGTGALILHFLRHLRAGAGAKTLTDRRDLRGLAIPWLGVAAAAVAAPWGLYLESGGRVGYALDWSNIWSQSWPLLVGAGLALLLVRHPPPAIPEGDLVAPAEWAVQAIRRNRPRRLAAWADPNAAIGRLAYWLALPLAMLEAAARSWSAAGAAALTLVLVLGWLFAD